MTKIDMWNSIEKDPLTDFINDYQKELLFPQTVNAERLEAIANAESFEDALGMLDSGNEEPSVKDKRIQWAYLAIQFPEADADKLLEYAEKEPRIDQQAARVFENGIISKNTLSTTFATIGRTDLCKRYIELSDDEANALDEAIQASAACAKIETLALLLDEMKIEDEWDAANKLKSINNGIQEAGKYGHQEIIEFLLTQIQDLYPEKFEKKKAKIIKELFSDSLEKACENGHLNILNWLAEQVPLKALYKNLKGEDGDFPAFTSACAVGNRDVIDRFFDLVPERKWAKMVSANNYMAFSEVAKEGYVDLLEQFSSYLAPEEIQEMIEGKFILASLLEELEAVKWFLRHAAPETKEAMLSHNDFEPFRQACISKNETLAKLILGHIDDKEGLVNTVHEYIKKFEDPESVVSPIERRSLAEEVDNYAMKKAVRAGDKEKWEKAAKSVGWEYSAMLSQIMQKPDKEIEGSVRNKQRIFEKQPVAGGAGPSSERDPSGPRMGGSSSGSD